MASGLKAGFNALRTAFHIGSSECGVVNKVCTLVLDTSCTRQISSVPCARHGLVAFSPQDRERVMAPAANAR